MTETRTEVTTHGVVEYEVVECDSCGQEVVEDEALDFKIGDREGKACEYCAEKGPMCFPDDDIPLEDVFDDWFDPIFLALFCPLFVIAAFHGLRNEEEEMMSLGYLSGILGGVLWTNGILHILTVVL